MRVEGYNTIKVTNSDFLTKIWFDPNYPKWGIFGPKIDFFIFFSKMVHYFSLIFRMKVEDHNARKLTWPNISKKILFGPNSQKWGIFGPKIDFFFIFFKNGSLVLLYFLHEYLKVFTLTGVPLSLHLFILFLQ